MNGTFVLHTLHVLAAGVWLGGLVFTVAVITPAFKRMEWAPAERIAERSAVGRQYSQVARLNLTVLLIVALLDWLPIGLGALALTELALLAVTIFLAELHAHYYAPRLAEAARGQETHDRLRLVRVSVGVSMLNLLLSILIVVLSSLRTP